MEHAELQGLGGLCTQCEQEWRAYVMEWPPKVVICPTCQDMMILQVYNAEKGTAEYDRKPYRRKEL